MALKKIPISEQSLLSSSIYINSFKRAIEELVYNSLDAGSTSIAVRVCTQDYFIQVLDNGIGISGESFSLLGQKYSTNKYVDIATLKSAPGKYGFCGLSLASIIDISQSVHISSKYQDSEKTWLKIFCNGKENKIFETLSRPSKGTTVEIKGFLYNLNIQKKSIDPIKELQNIKTTLQQLSLVHCNVSISLRDDCKNEIIFQIHKNRDIYKTIWSLFKIKEEDMLELQVEKNQYKIKAFISRNNLEKYNYECIFLNGKYITNSILHKKINENLAKALSVRKIKINKQISESENVHLDANIPFYFIFIYCPNYDFDITQTSNMTLVEFKNWIEMDKLVEKFSQFYGGNTTSFPLKERKIEKNCDDGSIDTRKKVKEIMDKILNNKSKQPGTLQFRNGVKGRSFKRKNKTLKDLIDQKYSNKMNNEINSCKSRNAWKIKKELNLEAGKNNAISKDTPKKKESNRLSKIKKQKQSASKKNRLIKKTTDSLIKEFEADTYPVEITCEKLNQKVDHVPEIDVCNIRKASVFQKQIEDNIQQSIQVIPNNLEDENVKTDSNKLIIKKSYDLLKPVIYLQDKQYRKFTKNNNLVADQHRKTSKYGLKYIVDKNVDTTYDSHRYKKIEGKEKKLRHFISDNSCANFVSSHEGKISSMSNERFAHTLKKRVTVIKNNNNKESIFSSNRNRLGRYQNNLEDISYSIDVNESQEVISCENYKASTYNVTYIKNTDMEYNAMRLFADNQSIQGSNVNFERTYTLDKCISLSHLTNNQFNHTYTLELVNSLCFRYCPELQDNDVTNKNNINHKNYIHENSCHMNSRSDDIFTNISSNTIEPYNFCEVVLNDELGEFKSDVENSYISNKKYTSCMEVKCIKNENIRKLLSKNYNSKDIAVKLNDNRLFEDINTRTNMWNHESNQTVNNSIEFKSINDNKDDVQNICTDANNFQIHGRHSFMPKGMSPITKNRSLHNVISHYDGEYYEDVIYQRFAKDVLLMAKVFEPTVDTVKDHRPKNNKTVNIDEQKHSTDLVFDSQSLKQAKVLGQVDCKFIATIVEGKSSETYTPSVFLALFDQHAVDERIRLEHNLSDYIIDSKWQSVYLNPVTLILNEDNYFYLRNYVDKFSQFGLECLFTHENQIQLNAIPKAIIGKNQRQVDSIVTAVHKLISEQVAAIKLLKGNVTLYPKSIMELVFSEACRYAIKFGDKLNKCDCTNMINSLANCKTPFQCAHGRPVMAILTELPNINQKYTINVKNIKKFKGCQ